MRLVQLRHRHVLVHSLQRRRVVVVAMQQRLLLLLLQVLEAPARPAGRTVRHLADRARLDAI